MEGEIMKNTTFKTSERKTLFDNAFEYELHWNNPVVFDAEVVVVMLAHDNGNELSRAISSTLNQKGDIGFSLLIVDDSESMFCVEQAGTNLEDERIVLATIPTCSVSQARNFAHYMVKSVFTDSIWICRLDADDEFAHSTVILDIASTLATFDHTVSWALAGNTLEFEGELLNRTNSIDDSIMTSSGVINRLEGMAKGNPKDELPSCNLWIRTGFKAVYPDIGSAEDHWLVAHLLLNHRNHGHLLEGMLHAKYTLSGGITEQNKHNGCHQKSRMDLYNSAMYWINTNPNPVRVCLGWGSEGIVWLEDGWIEKRFHSLILNDQHVDWICAIDTPLMPKAEWFKNNDWWVARYPFRETEKVGNVSLTQLSRFIEKCLIDGVAFLNITRSNFRLLDGELYHIDIGKWVVPFKIQYFRDMCAQLYLVFVQNYSDTILRNSVHSFRNDVNAMKKFQGFEQFYHREIHKHVYHQGAFKKPHRDIRFPNRTHDNVTLMVKSCAMEAELIERQSYHIIQQLCRYDQFNERILLLDPKEGDFLRQYTPGNLSKLLAVANKLEADGIFDRVLISPYGGHEDKVAALYQRWFSIESNETHNCEGVPVFPQLWGFEQVNTRYLLQMDADVMIARDYDDDVVSQMLGALGQDEVFGVGFNIPQPRGAVFKPYTGKFVPEVRFGLFDLQRIFEQRPFPNSLIDGKLKLSWYRSIEAFQNSNGWCCLRGGDPCSVYIHPPNILKQDIEYYDRTIDLTEQGLVPNSQRGEWDLISQKQDWEYPPRTEELIFTIKFSNPKPHWARAALHSLAIQTNQNWGAVIFDDSSSPNKQQWLLETVKELGDNFTLIRRKFGLIDKAFVEKSLQKICVVENPMIIPFSEKEILFDKNSVENINKRLGIEHDKIITPTYMARYPLGLSNNQAELEIDEFNIVSSVRGERLYKIKKEELLILHEYVFYNSDMTIDVYDEDLLRPTTYIPNMKKLEIDITYICNLTCAGCSRSSSQAPSGQHMSIDTVRQFLDESETRGIKWEVLHILGGEPTLHPNFVQIVTMIDDWFMENSPETDLKVITNGVSKKTQNNIMKIPKRWRYDNSFKYDRDIDTSHFEPFNLAPIDLPQWRGEDFTKGCYITQDSGIGLTPYGYFHCAIAGGIERIVNLGHGFKEMPEHPWQFLEMMKDYCQLCGHYLSDAFMERSERIGLDVSPETVSESWQLAYDKWKVKGDA
jgi:uncharacterized radical SAM superfamily Fe-S cluster-containing enzyme